MLLQVEAGTERWVQWARRKADSIEATRRDLKIEAMTKVFYPEPGTQVWVKCSREAGIAIRVSGASDVGTALFDSGSGVVSRALVTSTGTPIAPAYARLAITTVTPLTFGYSAAGLAGTDVSSNLLASAPGSRSYVAALDFATVFGFPAVFRGADNADNIALLSMSDLANPLTTSNSVVRYDSSTDAWSETTVLKFLDAAIALGTGLSARSGTFDTYAYKYTLASPFPGGAGGSLDLFTALDWADNSPGQGDADLIRISSLIQSYITSATPGAVTTYYDEVADPGHTTPLAYSCSVTLAGTEHSWSQGTDQATLVRTELLHLTRTWGSTVLLYTTVAGTVFVTDSVASDPIAHPPNHNFVQSLTGSSSYFPLTGGIGNAASQHPVEGTDELGNWCVVYSAANWSAAGQTTVTAVVNGSTVWTTSWVPVGPSLAASLVTNSDRFNNSLEGGRGYRMRRGQFGFEYTRFDTPSVNGAFWDGSTMTVETKAIGPDVLQGDFFWGVYPSGTRRITGWRGSALKFFVAGALVLTVPLDAGEYLFSVDEVHEDVFYTSTPALPQLTAGFSYKVSQADDGTWSYARTPTTVADTWKHPVYGPIPKVGDFVYNYGARPRGTLGTLATRAPVLAARP